MTRLTLLTTNLARGGAETQVAQLAMALRRRGWDVQVIALLPPTAFTEELAAAGVPAISLDMRPGAPNPLGLFRLLRHLRRFRPRILHAHMFHANLMARAARLLYPVPVVVSTIHSLAETSRASASVRGRDLLYRVTDILSDATVCVSPAVAKRHLAARAISRARVIPNGVDTSRFRPGAGGRARLREALGIGDRFAWLAAGRLMWKKDYPTLLRAMAKQPSGILLMAGEGPLEAELRGLAGANVRFLGGRADVPELMDACDGFALSSVIEGLPMVLLEAAAAGLPAVATEAGAGAVVDGKTGFVVPAGDPDALASAMQRLAGLPREAREAMARAAREHAVAHFEMERAVAEWERLYGELGGT